MAVYTIKVGSGMTAYSTEMYTGEDMAKAQIDVRKEKPTRSQTVSILIDDLKFCKSVLQQNAFQGSKEHSDADFAYRILYHSQQMFESLKAIEKIDPEIAKACDRAACEAIRAANLLAQWKIKQRHEPVWKKGKGLSMSGRDGGNASAAAKKREVEPKERRARDLALEVKARHPDWRVTAIRIDVRKKMLREGFRKISDSTIAAYIPKNLVE